MCIKKRPPQSKIVLKSSSIMYNEGSMLKEEFTSPNIDHICCVPGHARTTGNTLRTWGKFLRSLTHFASTFMKFWRTLKFPRRWGCSFFGFSLIFRVDTTNVFTYDISLFFFFSISFSKLSIGELLYLFAVARGTCLGGRNGGDEGGIDACGVGLGEGEKNYFLWGRDSGMGNVQSRTGKIISVMGLFLLLLYHFQDLLFLFLSWDGPCPSRFKLYTYNLDVSSVLC